MNLSWLIERIFQLHGSIPRLLWRDGRAFLPIHMMMEVTYHCNLRCTFCQYLDIIEGKVKPFGPSSRDLPLADIKRYIDDLPRGRLISFTGGETLVRKDFPDILAHAARHHRVHIVTNGSLISHEVAQSYIGLAPRRLWQNGLILIGVSLEGDEALHDRIVQRPGSWQRSIDGIRNLVRLRAESKKRFPKLDVKLVINKDTFKGMVEFMALAKSLGVDAVDFLAEHDLIDHAERGNLYQPQSKPPGVDPLILREQLIRCYELERESGPQIRLVPNLPIDEFVRHFTDDRSLDRSEYVCEGTSSRLGIHFDGRLAPMCPYMASGDMRRETIRSHWNQERLRAFRRATRDAGIYPGCHGCCNLKYVGDKPFGLAGVSLASAVPADEDRVDQGATTSAA